MKLRRILTAILVIVCMVMIFMFSSQTGESSSGLSNKVTNVIIDIFVRKYDTYSLTDRQEIFSTVSLLVRKCAHMTEYGILATLVFLLFFDFKLYLRVIISLSISFIYACTDEFHQTFISKRSGAFTDVMIDFAGALIFIVVATSIVIIIERHKRKKISNQKAKNIE